jgi:hypothetical protein
MTNKYANITLGAPTTTVVATGPTILSGIIINKAAANAIIAIYDGLAATDTLVGTITMPATLLATQNSIDMHELCMNKGLCIVTTTAQDITVAYRASI